MRPTEVLKEEHNAIKLMLKIAEVVCARLEAREKIEPDHLDQIVTFIRGFADKCHHAKEENLLFKAMEEAGMPGDGGPIGVMLREHDIGRQYVRGMSEAAASYRQGDDKASAEYVENARNYVALLTDHIFKEDNILYPMADQHLSADRQDKLVKEFERVEHEEVGEGQHNKFMGILDQLKSIYLD